MTITLDEMVSCTRRHVTALKSAGRLRELEKRANAHRPRGFKKALIASSESATAIIAELKKGSPSKGLIRAKFDPAALARELEAAGAAALSVLTDSPYYLGSLGNLQEASAAVEIPCLRKDFIVDATQVVETRAYGGDAILLIIAVLKDRELRDLHNEARHLGLDVLCQVHERDELKRAVDLGFELIAVNNHDLRTVEPDMENSLRFPEVFSPSVFRVAESGIDSRRTIERLQAAGYKAFLVGERLMSAESPSASLRQLLM